VNTRFGHVTDVSDSSLFPAAVLLTVGVVLLLLGLVGCIGALRENKCLVGLYFSLLLLALVGLGCGIGLAYMYRALIDRDLHDVLEKALEKYGANDTAVTTAIDLMQKEFHCCGVDNYTDWLKAPEGHNPTLPASCCKNSTAICDSTRDDLYKKGCYALMHDMFLGHIFAVYGVVGACGFVLLLALISACFLMRTRHPNGFIYRDLSDTEGMRV
jgi:hypothetical protein